MSDDGCFFRAPSFVVPTSGRLIIATCYSTDARNNLLSPIFRPYAPRSSDFSFWFARNDCRFVFNYSGAALVFHFRYPRIRYIVLHPRHRNRPFDGFLLFRKMPSVRTDRTESVRGNELKIVTSDETEDTVPSSNSDARAGP